MKPEPKQESNEQQAAKSEAPQLEMHKRVVKMADGKRDMIYFTFEPKDVRA